jgi:hypothetical protein
MTALFDEIAKYRRLLNELEEGVAGRWPRQGNGASR